MTDRLTGKASYCDELRNLKTPITSYITNYHVFRALRNISKAIFFLDIVRRKHIRMDMMFPTFGKRENQKFDAANPEGLRPLRACLKPLKGQGGWRL